MKEIRKDIQGLRALAVISVVLYHFNSDFMPSGFAGVDVFFVISGFLMTKIILSGMDKKNFSFSRFYQNRAKRILPALTIVIIALLIFGYLFMEPLTYKKIGEHSFTSLLFYSNHVYLGESGYFDSSSKEKFLLHTWSLSVEWQFYIIYPVILYVVNKVAGLKAVKISIVIMFIFSLSLSVLCVPSHIEFGYFMIPTRAWEMLVGGMGYAFQVNLSNKKKLVLSYFGVVLILFSYSLFTENTPWPGYQALLPVFAAAIVIVSNSDCKILTNGFMQWIGSISYSIYLIHWVILVSLKKMYFEINLPAYLISVLLLSYILHRFVESKRDYNFTHVIIFFLVIISAHIVSINGAISRLGEAKKYQVDATTFRLQNEGHSGVDNSEDVIYLNGSESNFDYILIGNSHARHYYSYILSSGVKVASLAIDGCNSTKHYYSKPGSEICNNRYRKTVEFINTHPGKKIIWASDWGRFIFKRDPNFDNSKLGTGSQWKMEINDFINDVKGSHKGIYLIGDTPGTNFLAFECLAKRALPAGKILHNMNCANSEHVKLKDINHVIKSTAVIKEKVFFINTYNSLCTNNSCASIINDQPIYTDYGHLSKVGSKIVGEYIFSQIK